MTKIKAFFYRHQVLIPFLVIALVGGIGLTKLQNDATLRREQICKAELEDRILIEDILNFVADNNSGSNQIDISTLPSELQQLIEQSQANAVAFNEFANERLDIPPEICNNTGLTEKQIREEQEAVLKE